MDGSPSQKHQRNIIALIVNLIFPYRQYQLWYLPAKNWMSTSISKYFCHKILSQGQIIRNYFIKHIPFLIFKIGVCKFEPKKW